MSVVRIIQGDVRERLPELPADSFDCIVTSPPYYGLRDYGCEGQIGLEPTLDAYLETIVDVCRELRRVLKPSGVFFLNVSDSYQKDKNLYLMPHQLGLLLKKDGWWVRSHIIWHKKNPMPESVTDRPTSAHETVWMLTKSANYYWDSEAVKEDCSETSHGALNADAGVKQTALGQNLRGTLGVLTGTRNIRNVWSVASHPFPGAHFATMPPEIAERCIRAGCPRDGRVLDPFAGSGTTGLASDRLGRDCTLIDLNTSYIDMAMSRIMDDAPLFAEVAAE